MSRQSEIYYRPELAICDDGVSRTAYVRHYRYDDSYAAATNYSVPAYVRVKGRHVGGFVMREGLQGSMPAIKVTGWSATDADPTVTRFVALVSGRNHRLVERQPA